MTIEASDTSDQSGHLETAACLSEVCVQVQGFGTSGGDLSHLQAGHSCVSLCLIKLPLP